ncbi:hypothetical protein LP420_15935 [Massilia sp. B-10]|nr:hypothetical protein LP420_15935 [Massilia sp. B-10]
MYAQARSYAEAVRSQARLDKKLRSTEDRIASFVYKVVSKPSPFASFATIVPSGPAAACLDSARRDVRIARPAAVDGSAMRGAGRDAGRRTAPAPQ